MIRYQITKARTTPDLSTVWDGIPAVKLTNFRLESSEHRPQTECQLQYDDSGIYGLYQVKDRYVRAAVSEFQGRVCTDSCVEFFVMPAGGTGYLGFEFNCAGVMLAHHVLDPRREALGPLAEFRELTAKEVKAVKVFHSLFGRIEPEIPEEMVWRLGFFLPFKLLTGITGAAKPESGTVWRVNFYKCADECSHPHWASWQPVSELNFHLPECFGKIEFA
ncbi:MAG: carbohydrate-binding family 9-like protein [Victivallaceae bacterium]|nr:carbohydrate-binding family 9-like protein [Victivallaceae bacterium]